MTNEEAIRWLKDIHHRFNPTGEKLENEGGDVHLQALDMAIEALKVKNSSDSLLTEGNDDSKKSKSKLDIISRSVAIKTLTDREHDILAFIEKEDMEYEEAHSYWCEISGIHNSVEILESLPSAEPRNKDAISREGLLKSWEELSPRGRTEFDQVIMTIPALPSAEPNLTKDGTLKVSVKDATGVGRVLVVDENSRGNLYYPEEEPSPLCALADRVCPFQGKEYAWCLTCPHISEEDRALVKKAVAEPKTGKWVRRIVGTDYWHCSECGDYGLHTDFCPMCGADMRGEEE